MSEHKTQCQEYTSSLCSFDVYYNSMHYDLPPVCYDVFSQIDSCSLKSLSALLVEFRSDSVLRFNSDLWIGLKCSLTQALRNGKLALEEILKSGRWFWTAALHSTHNFICIACNVVSISGNLVIPNLVLH